MNANTNKSSWAVALSIGATAFAAHAGGGFATGNQANTNFVTLGWVGIFSAVLAMLVLALTTREAQMLWNTHGCKNYKDLFSALFHPFDKLWVTFDVFYDIMVLMVVASCIAGAAGALNQYLGLNKYIGIVGVGVVILFLSIFGAKLVRMGSSYMGLAILGLSMLIYFVGLFKGENLFSVLKADFHAVGFSAVPQAVFNGFNYAAFQWVTIPGVLACGTILRNKKDCTRGMLLMLLFNVIGLGMSVLMLSCWSAYFNSVTNGTTLPTLTSLMQMDMGWLVVVYCVVLVLCMVSSGVVVVFGFVNRFENASYLQFVKNTHFRRGAIATLIMSVSMFISLAGLTNIVKYGYGYCGYWALVFVIAPLLTVGVYKNRKHMSANGGELKLHETLVNS